MPHIGRILPAAVGLVSASSASVTCMPTQRVDVVCSFVFLMGCFRGVTALASSAAHRASLNALRPAVLHTTPVSVHIKTLLATVVPLLVIGQPTRHLGHSCGPGTTLHGHRIRLRCSLVTTCAGPHEYLASPSSLSSHCQWGSGRFPKHGTNLTHLTRP